MKQGLSRWIRPGAVAGVLMAGLGGAAQAAQTTPETPTSIFLGGTLISDLTRLTDLLLGEGGLVVGGPNTVDFGNDGLLGYLLEDTLPLVGPDGIVTGLIGPQGLNLIGTAEDNGVVDGLVLGLVGNGGVVRELLFGGHGLTAVLTGEGSLQVVAPVVDLLALLLGPQGTVDPLVEGLLGTGLYGDDGVLGAVLPEGVGAGLLGGTLGGLADAGAMPFDGLRERFADGNGLFAGLRGERDAGAAFGMGGVLTAFAGGR